MDQRLAGLFTSPDLHFLQIQDEQALFLRVDRESYRRSIFLDARAIPLDSRPKRYPLNSLLDAAQELPVPPQPRWIFHIAHCGSTLLSRMIDLPGDSLVLREPPPLRQLALEAASGHQSARWPEKLALAHRLAARRFAADEPAIVKANVPANFILDDLLALDPAAPAILLYLAFEPYLLAILRDVARRSWVDRVTSQLREAIHKRLGEVSMVNTTERAAALWLTQILIFSDLLERHKPSRSLDAETLFSEPKLVADAALEHFGIAARPPQEQIDFLVSRYSKNPIQQFNEAARRGREDQDRIRLSDDLRRARQWLERTSAATGLPGSLHHPLIGSSAISL